MYPGDPWGPVGPDYPRGFRLWFGVIVAAVVIGGLLLSGCKRPGTNQANAILSHCADTSYFNGQAVGSYRKVGGYFNEALYDKCVDDSIFALEQFL